MRWTGLRRVGVYGMVALGSLLTAADAWCDVPPLPGQHVQSHDVQLDLGPYADVLPQRHTVAAGDTLRTIAKRKLGDVARWKEIFAFNPTVAPERLLVGTVLRLPARRQAVPVDRPETKDGPRHRWHFFLWELGWSSVRQFPDDGRVASRYRMCVTFAVRDDEVDAFRKTCAKEGGQWLHPLLRGEAPQRPAWIAAGPTASQGHVSDDDPVYHVTDHLRITRIAGGMIHTERSATKKHGTDGKPLSEKQVEKTRKRRDGVLLLLGCLGLGGLLLTARRRWLGAPRDSIPLGG